jgi:hypothetical protein
MPTFSVFCGGSANYCFTASNQSSYLMVALLPSNDRQLLAFIIYSSDRKTHTRTLQIERKRRKAGAALNHAKVAERLLAAQLRREALSHLKSRPTAYVPAYTLPSIVVD